MFTARSIHVPTLLAASILTFGVFTPISAGAYESCGATYTIKSGDSLGRIAKKCDVTVKGIIASNDRIKNASQISVGWTIQLPVEELSAVLPARTRVSEPATLTELKGLIVSSRSCAQLHTDDGEVYGLVSPKVLFRSGQAVTVRGAFAKKTGCSADKVLMVSELETAVN